MLKFLRIFASKTNIINKNRCNNNNNNNNNNAKCWVSFSYSTQTLSSSPSDSLYDRLLPVRDPRVSIVPILDQWAQEQARPVNVSYLKSVLKRLRNSKRFSRALQMVEWMGETKHLNLSTENVAVKLELIAKVRGVGDAENYFESLPETWRTFKVYGALLHCYAEKKLLNKAENLMQEMRKSRYNTTLSYNVMLNLYAKLGKHNKLQNLFQEMEEAGITCDKPTFCILLNSLADTSDLEGMQKILSKMEDGRIIALNWNVYIVAAKGFLKAGLAEKTSEMLKKAENLIPSRERKFAYLLILSIYASLGNKLEVSRMWNLYKAIGERKNVGYKYMISSLVRMDDIDEAEKIFEEWGSVNAPYDFRILNLLINAYAKKGLLGKAEVLVSKAIETGKEPPASTWDLLATGYHKNNQIEKAIETMRKAILANQFSWKLNQTTLAACLNYLKEKGQEKKAEEYTALLTERGLNSLKPSSIPNVVADNQQTHLEACA